MLLKVEIHELIETEVDKRYQALIFWFTSHNFRWEVEDLYELFKCTFIEVFIFHLDLQVQLLIQNVDLILKFDSIEYNWEGP